MSFGSKICKSGKEGGMTEGFGINVSLSSVRAETSMVPQAAGGVVLTFSLAPTA